jgi:hypothetical protein
MTFLMSNNNNNLCYPKWYNYSIIQLNILIGQNQVRYLQWKLLTKRKNKCKLILFLIFLSNHNKIDKRLNRLTKLLKSINQDNCTNITY